MILLLSDKLQEASNSGHVCFDFLLPTGLIIPLNVDFYATLDQIKASLWKEASKYPLFYKLRSPSSYFFSAVNKDGVIEELVDESQSLYDVRPMCMYLKLIERGDNEKHRSLKRQIGSLIGKALHGLDNVTNTEVADFRHNMGQYCQNIVRRRNWQGRDNKLLYLFPPRLRNTSKLPDHLLKRLSNLAFVIIVNVQCKTTSFSTTVQVPGESYPYELISLVFSKTAVKTGFLEEHQQDYILKVCGEEEFIYGGYKHYPLQQFKYLYQCLVGNVLPHLILLHKDAVLGEDVRPPLPPRSHSSIGSICGLPLYNSIPREVHTSWEVKQKVELSVHCVNSVDLPDHSGIRLEAGLYLGSECLCSSLKIDSILAEGKASYEQTLTFDVDVEDLPQATRLCIAVCKFTPKKKSSDIQPVAWVNTQIFDWRSRLLRGEKVLYMWPVTDEMQFVETVLHPIGNVATNPLGDKITNLSVNFSDYGIKGTIVFPSVDKDTDDDAVEAENKYVPTTPKMGSSFRHYLQLLEQVLDRDPLYTLCEQDKDLVWKLRYEVMNRYPYGLPKLLNSIKWTNRIDVEELQIMIQKWPKVAPERALELLDFAYPDRNIREFAVSCLNLTLTDEDLSQYMLQLVQALKFESYLSCPLVEFLLTRAIHNQRLGHQLFWLLKAETETPSVAVQFGLILEVYCLACEDHMVSLIRQSDALQKLKIVNELVKSEKYSSGDKREKGKIDMQTVLNQPSYTESLSNILCPLTPRWKLKSIIVDKCKFMDSKKRPLWLVWKNGDQFGENIYLLYKNGDDLRQDMLTLQMLQVMDSIWQAEGLDLRMNPYGCLATGKDTGMIEVVQKSETVANIIRSAKKTTFDKTILYTWIKEHNSVEKLDDAVEEFTLSCAGYCVATYVLGIGDRHSDNIMLKKSGQLFHIDFGHFLGNFKSKFGVKRERVPFVLTNHFVYVITKGLKEPQFFETFKKYCEDAYLILRKKNHLLITLFMLMLSTGIPQLTCVQDIDYIRDALALNMSEAQAIQHFREKFKKALNNSYKTSINWYIRALAKKDP